MQSSSLGRPSRRAIGVWLLLCAFFVLAMVVDRYRYTTGMTQEQIDAVVDF